MMKKVMVVNVLELSSLADPKKLLSQPFNLPIELILINSISTHIMYTGLRVSFMEDLIANP